MSFKNIFMLFIAMIFLGCGKNEKDQKINLSVAVWGSSPEETALVDRQIALFEKKYPNIKVTKEVVTTSSVKPTTLVVGYKESES
jgi:multiple sugar transport system substrate-binding protein